MKILLVEDDDGIAEPLGKGLEREGFEVIRAGSGRDALEAPVADVVILDLRLPDIDGYEVCRRLRARSRVPIIMVSARGEEVDRVIGLELGADDYIVKPFAPRELVARISCVLRRLQKSTSIGSHNVAHFSGWTFDVDAHRLISPEGEHVMSVVTLMPYELATSWRQEKERFQEALLRQLEVALPGINDHLIFAEGASPRTMERYTLNHLGALYGWEATPGDTGVDRLSHRTPIEGLFLSGHWTRPGGGLVPVMVSGMQTAQIVLGDSSVREVVESLGERA